MEDRTNMTDVVVVGGGLGGLAAATYAARGGRSVILCEKASALGGRAITTQIGEFRFNLGPHALYAGSHGIAVLRELGVAFTGGSRAPRGLCRRRRHQARPAGRLPLPADDRPLGLSGKLETARLLGGFGRLDPRPLARVPIGEWIDAQRASSRGAATRRRTGARRHLQPRSGTTERGQRAGTGPICAQRQRAVSRRRLADAGRWLARRGAGGRRAHRHRDTRDGR